MALRAGRVGVAPDQVNEQGKIIGGSSPGPTPPQPTSGHVYSTTPQVVGKWVDDKDIYEVVLPMTNNAAIMTDEIDTLIFVNGIGGSDSGNFWCVNSVSGLNSRAIYYTIATKTITFATGGGPYSISHAIVQYTKKEES